MRPELRAKRQLLGGEACWVLEDPLRAKFYRLGLAEYELLRRLDGSTPLQQAAADAQQTLGGDALDAVQAITLCRWLVTSQLAQCASPDDAALLSGSATLADAPRKEAFNPLFIKLPPLNPDRWLDRLLPHAAWLISWPALAVWAIVCCYALGIAAADWQRLKAESHVLLDPANWLRLAAVWTMLKIIHELCHGLACKQFGGNVPRAGLGLMVLAPVAFVDVTSSWRFSSKWQRIVVAAAGIYAELFMAALAVIAWSVSDSELVRRTAYDVALAASVATVVFNANPLMRFDGYYILADLLDLPNLYTTSRQYVWYVLRRVVLGQPASPPPMPPGRSKAIQLYAALALCWRLALTVSIACLLVRLLGSLGLIAAAIWLAVWVLKPAAAQWRQLWSESTVPLSRGRKLALGALGSVCLAAALVVASRPSLVRAPAVVDYSPLTLIRAPAPGFVAAVHVTDGQLVSAGQVLIELRNEELAVELREVEAAIAQSLIKSRILHQQQEQAKQQAEQAARAALQVRQAELTQQIASLVVTAPLDGRIVGRRLDHCQDTWLQRGDTLCVLGNEQHKELVVAVPQANVEAFQARRGQRVNARVRGMPGGHLQAAVQTVEPRATLHVPHEALSADNGGPLAVRLAGEHQERTELTRPHFVVRLALPPEEAAQLRAGQRADVWLRSSVATIGRAWWTDLRHWLERKIDPAGLHRS